MEVGGRKRHDNGAHPRQIVDAQFTSAIESAGRGIGLPASIKAFTADSLQ
jgi:hypothetical protein